VVVVVADDYDDMMLTKRDSHPSKFHSLTHILLSLSEAYTYMLEYNRSIRNDETQMYISA